VAPDLRGVKLEGYAETVALLNKFDKDSLKVMNSEIYQTAKRTVTQARALVPSAPPKGLSGWARPVKTGDWSRLTFNTSKFKSGIKTKLEAQRVRGNWTSKTLFLVNNQAAGNIYETAGRHTGKTDKSVRFIKLIEGQSAIRVRGRQGRVVIKTVDDNLPVIENDLRNSMNKATAKLNARLAT
jgi:hypothetical protein